MQQGLATLSQESEMAPFYKMSLEIEGMWLMVLVMEDARRKSRQAKRMPPTVTIATPSNAATRFCIEFVS
jgi:hypothetical protein